MQYCFTVFVLFVFKILSSIYVYPSEGMELAHDTDAHRGQITLDALELEFTGSCEPLDMATRDQA